MESVHAKPSRSGVLSTTPQPAEAPPAARPPGVGALLGALLGVCLVALVRPTGNSHSPGSSPCSPAACCSELISLQTSHGPSRAQWGCHSFLGHPQLCAPLGKVPICLRIPQPRTQPTDAGRFLLTWAGMRMLLTLQGGLGTRRHPVPLPPMPTLVRHLPVQASSPTCRPRLLADRGATCLSMAGICLSCSHCPA